MDRWLVMALHLAGEPPPALPPLPASVRHRAEAKPEPTDQRLQSYGRAASFVAKVAPGWRGWRP